MTKQLKMAETGAFRGPPPKAELLADVQIMQTGAPWPNLGRVPRMPNLPVAQRQQQRSRSPQGNRTNGEEAAPAGSNGKAGKKGGPKKGGKGEDPAQPIFEFATEESMRRGLFGGTPMTFIDGQDVDVPAYIRKAVRLPPAP